MRNLIILILIFISLYYRGRLNYIIAISNLEMAENTDENVKSIMERHGFSIGIYEQPTPLDYINSNF